MDTEPYASTISRAVELFEGYATLAVILNVSVKDLHGWAEGTSYPPADVLQRIGNLMGRDQREAAAVVTAHVRKSAWPPDVIPW